MLLMPREGFRSVKVSKWDWITLGVIAKRDYGMRVGQLAGLVMANWIRKRWPLDLTLALDRGCGRKRNNEKPQDKTSAPGPMSESDRRLLRLP